MLDRFSVGSMLHAFRWPREVKILRLLTEDATESEEVTPCFSRRFVAASIPTILTPKTGYFFGCKSVDKIPK